MAEDPKAPTPPATPPVETPATPVASPSVVPPSGAPLTIHTPPPPPPVKAGPFKFTGSGPGGPFNIDGQGFGAAPGRVIVAGREVTLTRWKDTSIKGYIPSDMKPGPVEVTVNDQKITAVL